MKFYEQYHRLQKKDFLAKVLTDTVFSTMSLENQTVPKAKVVQIVEALLQEQVSKGEQFFVN